MHYRTTTGSRPSPSTEAVSSTPASSDRPKSGGDVDTLYSWMTISSRHRPLRSPLEPQERRSWRTTMVMAMAFVCLLGMAISLALGGALVMMNLQWPSTGWMSSGVAWLFVTAAGWAIGFVLSYHALGKRS